MDQSAIFDQPDRHRALALEVEERKFWVSREILAWFSPVFKAMLYGEFAEANKDVIPLPGKKAKDVEELMHCLHPGPRMKSINDENLKLLLEFADEYQIEDIVSRAEQYLIYKLKTKCDAGDAALLDMLRIGSYHRMKDLLMLCLKRCAMEFDMEQLEEVISGGALRSEVVASLMIFAYKVPLKEQCRFSLLAKGAYCDSCKSFAYNVPKCILCSKLFCGKCIATKNIKDEKVGCCSAAGQLSITAEAQISDLLDRMYQ